MQWTLGNGGTVVLVALALLVVGFVGVGVGSVDSQETGPLADAGLDQSVAQGTTVYLDAGGSVTPDGEIEAYEWTIESPAGEQIEPECPDCVRTSFVPDEIGTYVVSVTVTDDEGRTDTDTLYVEVEPRDVPEASLDGPGTVLVNESNTFTLTAYPGEAVLSSARWERDGTHDATEVIDSAGVSTLDRDLTFDVPGVYTINTTIDDEAGFQVNDSHEVSVWSPTPYVEVQITGTTAPVQEGDTLTVEATAHNLGERTAKQPVWLTNEDELVLDTTGERSLASGEQRNVTLQWDTDPGDAGVHELGVHSVNDSDSTAVAVVPDSSEPGETFFDVEFSTEPNSTVTPGETVQPTVRVVNTGTATGSQQITLVDIHGQPVDTHDLTLGPGESKDITSLSWTTTVSDRGSGELQVQSEDDRDRSDLSVWKPAFFDVNIYDAIPPAEDPRVDNHVLVIANVTNTGDLEDTQDVWLEQSSKYSHPETVNETTVTLDGGNETTLTMYWPEAVGSAFRCPPRVPRCSQSQDTTVTILLYSEDDSDGETVTLETAPDPHVSEYGPPRTEIFMTFEGSIEAGDSVSVSGLVESHRSGLSAELDPGTHSAFVPDGDDEVWFDSNGNLQIEQGASGTYTPCLAAGETVSNVDQVTDDPELGPEDAPTAAKGQFTCKTITVGDGGGGGGQQ